jgi:hypothetical protein
VDTAGTLSPRTLAAMAATLGGYVGVRVAVAVFARSRYLPGLTRTYPVAGVTAVPNTNTGDWVVSYGVRSADGTMVAPNSEVACPVAGKAVGRDCGADLGLGPGAYTWQLYQPGSRFWLFQTIETGIFVALAVGLIYLAVRRIRQIA